MNYNQYKIEANIWLYPGKAAWHFVTLPPDIAKDISQEFEHLKHGWGSLKVKAKIGNTIWETSIFPDKKSSSYLLPIKTEIRKIEQIKAGDTISVLLEVRT